MRSDGRLRRVLAWGAVNARPPSAERSAGALPLGLRRRLGQVSQGQVLDTLQEPVPAVRRAAAADARRRVQGPERLVLDDPGVAAPAAAPRLRSLAPAAHELASSTSPTGRARYPSLEAHPNWTYDGRWQGVFGRYSYLGAPVYGLSSNAKGRAEGQVRPKPVHRHPELRVRAGLEARVRDPDAQGHGTFCHSFVPQRPFSGYPSQEIRPARGRRASPDHGRRAGRDAGDAGRARGSHAGGSGP